MYVKIAHFINQLRHSFWFVPSLMVLVALLLGYVMQRVDVYYYHELGWELTDPAGARAILTTVAASAITVAGVVFSITMVVLSSASSQFGPRLIRNFMRHPQTKWVLGGYIGTFIYCLMVAATVRGGDSGWTPQLSVTTGGVFGVLSFGLLIAFVHHVFTFIQAPRIIQDVTDRLNETINILFPLSALPESRRDALSAGVMGEVPGEFREVRSEDGGYIQAIGLEDILDWASENEAMVKIDFKPGDYLLPGEKLGVIWCESSQFDAGRDLVRREIMQGPERTDDQDVEFVIDQLVEIAVRALSPGVNDPFTAINCINKLGGVITKIVERGLPGGLLHDKNGVLRVATKTYTYAGLLDAAFHQIRQNARGVESVSLSLIDILARLKEVDTMAAYQAELRRHAELLREDVQKSYTNEKDLQDFMERYSVFEQASE
ncbi:Uncharacterized membrane protein [Rubritalea squalenifaciens DSM 18772]|uniref:Uncharacterized membrane protein n=1 Tax=Rubritalea squalenifaciens DSM 18772 TaxID=1123071 RepID=A0A1M6IV47_9BACT|nr:DUF2254 domain-containing protein [Rubritalea squalenifaciens]SHJ38274.1 Uncharacterized membrane protein [Rubritalea squalenifaciens DSM 18772]